MKDFDRAELGAVRKMSEANYFFDRHKDVACRQIIHSRYREKVKETYNKIFLRKGAEGELS
jgi:hypothetical protein